MDRVVNRSQGSSAQVLGRQILAVSLELRRVNLEMGVAKTEAEFTAAHRRARELQDRLEGYRRELFALFG